ncbi:DMT family transporter [Desulfovibrio desulfuricans]|uniref:DMT family transporter n=1 Tax=Desulfovibrio desulfuricans TaxID=876 RepID=A0A4P7UNF2_DESDE|nr:DMT family transporter [Desulfovibrio desulfuricans]QCC86414.1 DMT family transporter [Desulfovibrio desulfuricans]
MEKSASVERSLEAHKPGLGNGSAGNTAQKRLSWRHVAVGVCFSIIWSSAFVAGKIVVTEMGPFVSLFYRFVGTVFVLGFLCGKRLWGPHAGRALRVGFVLGLLNNVGYLGLSFSALQLVSPPWVVVIVSCSPFVTLILGVARRLESFSAAKLLGFGLSLAGIVVMVGVGRLEGGAVLGLLLASGATVAFSVGAVLFRGRYSNMPLLPVNFWMSVCAMFFFAPAGMRSAVTPLAVSIQALLALGWLAVVSLLGMALWLLLIRTQGASTAAAYNMLNPLSGLALSVLFLGLPILPADVAGSAAIVAGLAVALACCHRGAIFYHS